MYGTNIYGLNNITNPVTEHNKYPLSTIPLSTSPNIEVLTGVTTPVEVLEIAAIYNVEVNSETL